MAMPLSLFNNMDWTMTDGDLVDSHTPSVDLMRFGSTHVNDAMVQHREPKQTISFITDTPKREMIPKERWEPLKAVVQRLYVEEDRKIEKVLEYLKENYGLKATKRQLLPRISAWGMEKNIKKKERRAILQKLDTDGNIDDIDTGAMGSRKYSRAKIERWKRLEGSSNTLASISTLYQSHENNLSHAPLESFDLPQTWNGTSQPRLVNDQEQTFDTWATVDFIDSPRLTGLIGRLTLEISDAFEELDLSALDSQEDGEANILDFLNSTDQPSHVEALIESPKKKHSLKIPVLFKELNPFPQMQQRQQKGSFLAPNSASLTTNYSLKMKESECKQKIHNIGTLDLIQMTNLVEDMRSIASRYGELEQNHLEEAWWRRVVNHSRRIPGYQPVRIWEACLRVIHSRCSRGKLVESRNLHEGVHKKIISVFPPDHELTILSNSVLGSILILLGEKKSEERLQRELIPILLSKYGVKSHAFGHQLSNLGSTLLTSGKLEEAETILCLRMQLDRNMSDHAKKSRWDRELSLQAMLDLALIFRRQQRYGEMSNILDFMESHCEDLLTLSSHLGRLFFHRKADGMYAEGDLLGAENLLRTILEHLSTRTSWDLVNTMWSLARILESTDRATEALLLRERILSTAVQLCGIENRFSMWYCLDLGDSYASLGRYVEAIRLYQQTIEKLSVDERVKPETRSECTETLHEWIRQVQDIKWKKYSAMTGTCLDGDSLK